MDISELYAEREELIAQLDKVIEFKKNVGRKLARAEYEYKKARTKLMARMMIVGYETEHGDTKPIAATAVYNMAQGDEEIALLKLQRDLHQADADVTQEKIYQLKLQINILNSDIENVRKMI